VIPKAPAASAIDVMPIILEDWKHLVQRNLIPSVCLWRRERRTSQARKLLTPVDTGSLRG